MVATAQGKPKLSKFDKLYDADVLKSRGRKGKGKVKVNKVPKKQPSAIEPFGVYHPTAIAPKHEDWKGWTKRICIGVPTTGNIRVEWMMAKNSQVIPCNWSNGDIMQFYNQFSPIGCDVANARNFCVAHAIQQGYEWMFFIDHDVLIPPDTYLKIDEYMRSAKYPIVNGLYYCKGSSPQPLLFKGRGNSHFDKWKRGEKVMVNGAPMGCTLIHISLLQVLYNESEQYTIPLQGGQQALVRRVFETPRMAWQDPQSGKYGTKVGTEDMFFYDRLTSQKVYERAGWKKFQKMKYPLLVDTSIFCQHIDGNGVQYPANVGIV